MQIFASNSRDAEPPARTRDQVHKLVASQLHTKPSPLITTPTIFVELLPLVIQTIQQPCREQLYASLMQYEIKQLTPHHRAES